MVDTEDFVKFSILRVGNCFEYEPFANLDPNLNWNLSNLGCRRYYEGTSLATEADEIDERERFVDSSETMPSVCYEVEIDGTDGETVSEGSLSLKHLCRLRAVSVEREKGERREDTCSSSWK